MLVTSIVSFSHTLLYPPQNNFQFFINPFPNNKFYTSKLKEIADDNFKFDQDGKKFSKWVENTVGKGEIARSEQFLLFPQCFQKAKLLVTSNFSFSHSVFKRLLSQGRQKASLCGNGLNTFYHTILTFNYPEERAYGKHDGKRRNCW